MLKANIETFLACDASYEEAGIVLYGAPFDSTTSYRPGTRFGSRAIRSESYGLESYSPYQDRDLTDYAVFDAGDQELCFGDASLALKDLRERAAEVAGDGKIPFMLGGEHLVTLAPVQALAEKVAEGSLQPEEITEDLIGSELFTGSAHADAPDPELIIRTSGEERLSNFLLWQSAYSELVFADALWPDFTPEEYEKAIEEYQSRDRRFGGR